MDTSKETKELPMTFPDSIGMVYLWFIQIQGCSTSREAANVNNKKPHNLERTLEGEIGAEAASRLLVSVTSMASFRGSL